MILSPESSGRILDRLRAAAILGQFAAIGTALILFGATLSAPALLTVTGAFAAWHAWGWWGRRRGSQLDQGRLTLEILIDVAVITALLCLAGGWTNPFVSIYLVPVGFAAALLPPRRALLVGGAAFAGYLVGIFLFVPLPTPQHVPGAGFSLHLLGMLISFVLAAVIILGTVLLVRRAYDEERAALARERESRLRDEQLLSLGVLAASTAHELGTPLSTARMLVEAMEDDGAVSAADLALVGQHLDQAAVTLRRLVSVAALGEDPDVSVASFCAQLTDRFRTLRPDVELTVHELPREQACLPGGGGVLESAVLSLLINAATASAAAARCRVDLSCRFAGETLTLHIRDYGAGFDAESPGTGTGNGSAGGLGVGLVISSATLERHGGSARHYACEPGTEVVVTLPLSRAGSVP